MHSSNANGSSAMDVQLEPQLQLLSRIQYVINTGNQFGFFSGESGVGKSFLTSMLLDSLTSTLVIELRCRKKFNFESFSQEIICQLATDDLSDINQSMAQAIQNAINYYGQSILIVIDDADYMPQNVISSLWHSFNEVLAAPQLQKYKLNILLVGSTKWARPIVAVLQEKHPSLVADFELSSLSTEQGIDFLMSIHPDWSDQKIKNCVATLKSQGLTPQRLIFAELPVVTNSSFTWLVSVFVIFFLLTVITITWFFTGHGSNPKTEKIIQVPPKLIVLSDKQRLPLLMTAETEIKNGGGLQSEQQQPLAPIAVIAKNNMVTSAALSIEEHAKASSAVATAAHADTSSAVATAAHADTSSAVATAAHADTSSAVATAVHADTSPAVATAVHADTDQRTNTGKGVETFYLLDEKILLEVSESYVSLMLGGYSHQSVLQRAMAKISDKTDLYAYKTIRNGEDWFVLLYGNFASRALARRALASASSQLAIFSPWIKSFRVIHAEITAVAATMDNNN